MKPKEFTFLFTLRSEKHIIVDKALEAGGLEGR